MVDALDNLSIIIKNVNDITGNGNLSNNFDSTLKGNNVSIEAAGYARNTNESTIEADNVSILADSFTNNHNSTLKGSSVVDIVAGTIVYNTNASTIEADNVSIEAVGFVENTEGSTIDTDSLTIVASYFNNLGSPSNPGNVITDSFALSVAGDLGDFNYEDDFFQNGNISGVSSQYFTARNGNFINPNNVDIRLTGDFGVTANNFFSTGEVIDVANLSIVVSEAFGNTADLTANSIYIEAEGNVSNASTIDADDLTIISNTGFFFNAGATIPGVGIGEPDTIVPTGDIITDRFTLSVATNHVNGGEDFDYREHLLDNGKITSLSSLNFTLTGDGHFTVSGDNIALTGDLGITANSFTNTNATIEANNVDIQTTIVFCNSIEILFATKE